MTIQEMKKRKQELGYTNEELSSLTGIPLGTIMKIFGGATKSPRRSTIEALEKILLPGAGSINHRKTPDYTHTSYDEPPRHNADSSDNILRETASGYGNIVRMKQNDVNPVWIDKPNIVYTVDDYYALPDDIRTELIDGVFYDMASPSVMHQLVLGELYMQFKACEKKHNGSCRVILSPCDVQLDCDRYTIVQPDLLVVCDGTKIKGRNCLGAPDLCVEVLSPTSRSHDCVLKLNKYKRSGVREYWIIDPEHRKVITYWFDGLGSTFETFTFTDLIPIRLSDNECTVNMKDVLDELTRR